LFNRRLMVGPACLGNWLKLTATQFQESPEGEFRRSPGVLFVISFIFSEGKTFWRRHGRAGLSAGTETRNPRAPEGLSPARSGAHVSARAGKKRMDPQLPRRPGHPRRPLCVANPCPPAPGPDHARIRITGVELFAVKEFECLAHTRRCHRPGRVLIFVRLSGLPPRRGSTGAVGLNRRVVQASSGVQSFCEERARGCVHHLLGPSAGRRQAWVTWKRLAGLGFFFAIVKVGFLERRGSSGGGSPLVTCGGFSRIRAGFVVLEVVFSR